MALETASYLHQLNPANPAGSDRLQQGDDHIRLIKAALKATFPNLTGPITLTQDQANGLPAAQVPIGSIVMFSGPAIPSGWAVCNGQIVARSDGTGTITTPDLRDRVPVGAGGSYSLGAQFGQVNRTHTTTQAGSHTHSAGMDGAGSHSHGGGAADHALTIAEMPAHSHGAGIAFAGGQTFVYAQKAGAAMNNGNVDFHTNSPGSVQAVTETIGGGQSHSHAITVDGGHVHNIGIGGVGDHSHQVTIDTTQPAVALHFIMKI